MLKFGRKVDMAIVGRCKINALQLCVIQRKLAFDVSFDGIIIYVYTCNDIYTLSVLYASVILELKIKKSNLFMIKEIFVYFCVIYS